MFYALSAGEGFDNYNGGSGIDLIFAYANNVEVGLGSSFDGTNSIEAIVANGKSNFKVVGDVTNDTWDFSYTILSDVTVHSGAGDDTVTAGAGVTGIDGAAGNDIFAYNDFMFGSPYSTATSWLNGGADNDTINLNTTQSWVVELDNGTQYFSGGSGNETLGDDSGTVTFNDGTTITFQNIEQLVW